MTPQLAEAEPACGGGSRGAETQGSCAVACVTSSGPETLLPPEGLRLARSRGDVSDVSFGPSLCVGL